MPRTCDICGRKPLRGNSRSHSNVATARWQNLNIQNKIIDGKKMHVCTQCIKTRSKYAVKK